MSQTVRKNLNIDTVVPKLLLCRTSAGKILRRFVRKQIGTYHKQKMNNITDYDADESYSKVMPW